MANQMPVMRGSQNREHLIILKNASELKKLLLDVEETCHQLGSVGDCQSCSQELAACCKGRFPSYIHHFMLLVDVGVEQNAFTKQAVEELLSLAEQGRIREIYYQLHLAVSDILKRNDELS